MAILNPGEYLGLHKQDELYLHKFRPMAIAFNGTVEYVRIGKPNTKFIDDREYITDVLNVQEQEMVDDYNSTNSEK